MRALGWDDEPEKYFKQLKRHLLNYEIDMEVEEDEGEFLRRFRNERWELVITDLAKGEDINVGQTFARTAADKVPVYVVTEIYETVRLGELDLPAGVVVKSKDTPPPFMAYEIRRDLDQRGLYVDHKSVFLIYGHDREAEGASEVIANQLDNWGLTVETLSDEAPGSLILQDLHERMPPCGAFVAICTPDDWVEKGGYFQPRQNVLFEIGMAMGLSNGPDRLAILQRWGDQIEVQARLPTDLEGLYLLRFGEKIAEALSQLQKKLQRLGSLEK